VHGPDMFQGVSLGGGRNSAMKKTGLLERCNGVSTTERTFNIGVAGSRKEGETKAELRKKREPEKRKNSFIRMDEGIREPPQWEGHKGGAVPETFKKGGERRARA